MKVLSLKLSDRVRPVFWCGVNGSTQKCLFDTGANISVYTGNKEEFLSLFKDAVLKYENYRLTGFGGDGEMYSIYVIPIVSLSCNDVNYTVHNMLIAVSKKVRYDFRLILSPALFTKSRVEWSYQERALNIFFEKEDNYMKISMEAGAQIVQELDVIQGDEQMHPLLRAAKHGEAK